MKARKKPIDIEFLIWTGNNHRKMYKFLGGYGDDYTNSSGEFFFINYDGRLVIKTSEGDMVANIGDYIIKEPFDKVRGYYPCKPEIFLQTYDIVE